MPLSREQVGGHVCGFARIGNRYSLDAEGKLVLHAEDCARGPVDDLYRLGDETRVVRGDKIPRWGQHHKLKCLREEEKRVKFS